MIRIKKKAKTEKKSGTDSDTNTRLRGAVLVDATNAFNSLNRQTTLRNIQYLCPSFSTILINMHLS